MGISLRGISPMCSHSSIHLQKIYFLRSIDLRIRLRGAQHPKVPIALVLIDDQSITELGRWPWSRHHFATVVRQLATAGARVIAFDLLFSEPEAYPTRHALQALRTAFEVLDLPEQSSALQEFHKTLVTLAESEDPDTTLATALREARHTLLAFSFETEASGQRPALATPTPQPFVRAAAYRALQRVGPEPPILPLIAGKLLLPIAPLAQAAQSIGHVKIAFDTDGTPRYEYPVVSYQDVYYPSLALQALRLYFGLALEEVQVRFGVGIQLGALFVPTDEAMRLLINYYGPVGTFPTYSFVDVLHNRFPEAAFRDTMVLIGAAATGLGDTFVTPFSMVLPGIERHATVIANALRGDALQRRDPTALLDLGAMAVLGLVTGWLGSALPWSWGMLVTFILGAGYAVLNGFVVAWGGLWGNLLFPLLTVVGNYGAITSYKFLTEARQRRMLRRAFQHYPASHRGGTSVTASRTPRLGGREARINRALLRTSRARGFGTVAQRIF
jgi:adenylate cyclase